MRLGRFTILKIYYRTFILACLSFVISDCPYVMCDIFVYYVYRRVLSIVGKGGEIDTELKAIIIENNLDISPYQDTLLEGLPDSDTLTEADIKDREDWRHECVFTIDPMTAVDIDDALSCKVLDNGNYEVIAGYITFSHSMRDIA